MNTLRSPQNDKIQVNEIDIDEYVVKFFIQKISSIILVNDSKQNLKQVNISG